MMEGNSVLTGLILATLAGAATPIGGVMVASPAIARGRRWVWPFGMGVSAGVMVYLSVFDLLPEARALVGDNFLVPVCFVVGLAVTWVIDLLTCRWAEPCGAVPPDRGDCPKRGLLGGEMGKVGLVAALAIALHNFPEGIATFLTGSADLTLGLPVALAVAIHNIPEGFCVALPVFCSSGSVRRAVAYSAIAGFAEPLGALVAWIFLAPLVTPQVLGCLFAAVAGIMVYVAVDELIPAGRRLGHGHLCLSGFIVGAIVMWAAMLLIGRL